ncbi:malectin domain-containing carbohydrate-binding protein, partial [Halomonas sp. 1390]|uniref:malectin domain-containing carbohydrate-binding protein n=1 Tax=Halomonas sp. B23F22_3 TaxID=3459516 RepID=UPI00373F3369
MVTDNFSKSGLDLNGVVNLSQPTALVWGADGRLYVTEVSGSVKVLTVAFGDKDPTDGDPTSVFYVTAAETVDLVTSIPNFNDDGTPSAGSARQVTGIDVVPQYDADGFPVIIDGKPAVTLYVTSSDSRIGAGGDGNDSGLDTNSGVITRIDQTETGWTAVDLVRGLARSEENHALNGLEIIQELDETGRLVSERMIVANGGNTNTGAPSNNFAGQQETAYSAAILEVDLDQLKSMPVFTDPLTGRAYVYDIPTLDDPTRIGTFDDSDPFGGNDGLNAGKIDPDGPVQIYSAGYRNAYDVEVTEDGRVWTYDNGANNSWGGRPIGEAGDDGGTLDYTQLLGYIATNLNNGDVNTGDTINLEAWSPKNYDQFHEVTRSDDLEGRLLSAGQGDAATYEWTDPDTAETLTLVYGGHPNPTRASGGQSGILFTPKDGVEDAYLLLSSVDKDGPGTSDFAAVHDWLSQVESQYGSVGAGELTGRLIGVVPGEHYYITDAGNAYLVVEHPGDPATINGETVLGDSGMPADFDSVVASINPVEGDYREGGFTDGALDSGKGSINGLTEYTSTLLDDPENGIKMSGAILAASLNQGTLIVMGRDADGVMQTTIGSSGQTLAEERTIISVSGAPLGLASIGDDLTAFDGQTAFQGSIWTTVFKQNGPFIEILQPNNGTVPLAGSVVSDPTDHDLDGVDHLHDPFEFSDDNGFDLGVGEQIFLDFQPTGSPYPGTILDTGLMGAALDGVTPNRDAKTAEEGFGSDQQEDGLYDLGGNIIPGGNAPIFQIKKVAGGTVVGTANSARDAMHVGIRPTPDVERLILTTKIKNWVPSVTEGPRAGQLTGFMLGDGTQSNFLRLVFGAVVIDGVLTAGFEVGYEVDDVYTVLTRVAAPELAQSDVATVDLHLTVDIADGFSVAAGYQLNDDPQLTSLDLGGFRLPTGVLQDILTGAHSISDGDTTLPSGAAVGFLAETSEADAASEDGLAAIDFYHLSIEARGNDIAATTGDEVGTEGTEGIDTIVYTGTDTVLAPLADSVENFDGSGSTADFQVIGHAGDNVLIAGAGNNTFTGGGGADSIRGSVDSLDGSVITDFFPDDELLILGSYLDENHVGYALDGTDLLLTFTDPDTGTAASVRLTGEQFVGFDPLDGPAAFVIETTPTGTRVTYKPETVLYRVNAGGNTVAALDGELNWQGDIDPGFAYLVGDASDVYGGSATDQQQEIDLSYLNAGIVPWELFTEERYDGSSADPQLEYAFPVTAGNTYEITVYYTENWGGIFGYSGERRFDIEVEGFVPEAFSGLNPVEEASALLGSAATQDDILGFGLSRTYVLEATDDTLNLAFLHGDQNPKVNGIEIKQLGVTLSSPDTQPPVVDSISVEAPTDADSPLIVTVVVSDDRGVDLASIGGDELAFTGIEPASVGLAEGDAIAVSADGKTVTILYQALPPSDTNAWPGGDYSVAVLAGGYLDEAGNAAEAFASDFQIRLGEDDTAFFVLDFETVGEPLDEGGFDGMLGGITDATVLTAVEGGDLVVQTSDGDISREASANDFIKYADLSAAEINEVRISSRFDNPFPQALAAQGLSTSTIPNYAQQGIVFGLGTQEKNELVKLVFGGNKGNAIQIWSRPDSGVGIDTVYSLDDLFSVASLGLEDVAELEMTLIIDKAAGTVTPELTLFDATGAVIGGLRSVTTEGFVTAQVETLPAAVLDNLLDETAPTAIGVTSNDFGKLGAYEARWQYLEASSPDITTGPTLVAIADAPTVTESGDTGTTTLAFAVTTAATVTGTLTLSYQVDGGATQTQAVSVTDGVGTLSLEVANDDVDDGPDSITVVITEVAEAGYAIDPAADTAAGTVAEDDTATLVAIADAPTVTESGDTGTTTLAFAVTTAATVTGTLTLS